MILINKSPESDIICLTTGMYKKFTVVRIEYDCIAFWRKPHHSSPRPSVRNRPNPEIKVVNSSALLGHVQASISAGLYHVVPDDLEERNLVVFHRERICSQRCASRSVPLEVRRSNVHCDRGRGAEEGHRDDFVGRVLRVAGKIAYRADGCLGVFTIPENNLIALGEGSVYHSEWRKRARRITLRDAFSLECEWRLTVTVGAEPVLYQLM